jgi:hypothetical protein
MATEKHRSTEPHRIKQILVRQILAAAVTRNGKVVPSWPEKGTGRTAPLATCGHCGGKPLIIRRCGQQRQPGDTKPRPRYCAVCVCCGAHRAIQAACSADTPVRCL